jgi:PMP-22/EMP/MP20/Claudin tight junction
MLTACLLASGAMGLWHTVEFFEKEKVVGDEYFQSWPKVTSHQIHARKHRRRSLIITQLIFRF